MLDVVKSHGSSVAAERSATELLGKVAQAERWMVGAWAVVEGRVVMVGRSSWDFPHGDFLEALSLMAHELFEESKRKHLLPSDPLPETRPTLGDRLGNSLDEALASVRFPDNDEDGADAPELEKGPGAEENWELTDIPCPKSDDPRVELSFADEEGF